MKEKLQLQKKLILITGLTTLIFLLLIARLVQLQIVQGNELYKKSERNFLQRESLNPPRGQITDRHGVPLATNRPVIQLYWQGTGNKKITDRQKQLLEALLHHNVISSEIDEGMLQRTERFRRSMLLAEDLSIIQLGRFMELAPNEPNLFTSEKIKRFYPFDSHCCHLLGYITSKTAHETIGSMGLEAYLHEALKGKHGYRLKTVNSCGSQIAVQPIEQVIQGNTIRTTICHTTQKLAEKLFPEEFKGAFLMMDPTDGSIEALVSRPEFNPNIFLNGISFDTWQDLQSDEAFLNRATHGCYPPASIFKLVSAAAALEQKIITPETPVYCRGYTRFKGRLYWCNKKTGHGFLNALEAVTHSCNILFYDIAQKLTIDVLADYAFRFGLGKKTGILLGEREGLIPTSAWKLQTKGERWWPGETLSAIIGQSYLLVTPLQMIRLMSSIFEGYLCTPRILEADPIERTALRITNITRKFLQEATHQVVMEGTGKKLRKLTQYKKIFAKTGTGQTSSLEKRTRGGIYLEHGWCALYVVGPDDEAFSIIIVLEHAGSSQVAIEYAREFLKQYYLVRYGQN